MKEDVEKVRYPKKMRDLAAMEARAVEIGVYVGLSVHGLLQTPEHARALFGARQPPYPEAEVERLGLPCRRSASCRKRPRCAVASEAQWSGVDNSNICWR